MASNVSHSYVRYTGVGLARGGVISVLVNSSSGSTPTTVKNRLVTELKKVRASSPSGRSLTSAAYRALTSRQTSTDGVPPWSSARRRRTPVR